VRASLSTWWSALASRERALLQLTLVVVLGALVWWVGLAPALRTVRAAPAQLETLDQQWLAMQNLAAQARSLQARSPISRQDALRELEASVQQRLGGAGQVSSNADRATVTLRAAAPQALAGWLSQARLQARVVATQATLTRGPAGWDGTVVFTLPPSP